MRRTRSVGVCAGYLIDLLAGDPRRGHPVAAFGRSASAFERLTYRDNRIAGLAHIGVLLTIVGACAVMTDRTARRAGPIPSAGVLAATTWFSLGGNSLARTGREMAALLSAGEIDRARELLPSLCGRDPANLDADGLARAALESIAENTSDAQVAPLFWAAIGSVPGIAVYRCVNTLDAMIGYRSPRYSRFGWAAARFDDMANYVAARITGILVAVCAPAVGGSPVGTLQAWRADASRHPSPNAGVVESAFAGALGIQLGGPTPYRHGVQIRPVLGSGRTPTVDDLRRAVSLSLAVQAAAAALAVAFSAVAASVRRTET